MTTTERLDVRPGDDRHRSLLVVTAASVDVVALPPSCRLVVGRSAPADIVVDEPGVSRRHLLVERSARGVEVTDLGSRNGTVIATNGQGASALPAHVAIAVLPGDVVTLGGVRLHLLGATDDASHAAAAFVGHERIVADAAAELVRATTFQRPWSWAFVRVAGGDLAVASVACAAQLRAVDRVGVWARDVVEIVLPERDAPSATTAVQALVAALPAGSAAVIATWPATATTIQGLLGALTDALARASAGRVQVVAAPRLSEPSEGPVAVDPRTIEVFSTLRRVARSPISVLVTGETGVGKEVIASTLHASGERARGPFVAVNCGALPATLVESTLFGHEKGAFTGADVARKGAFEQADGGTLFLDEIGDLPLAAQVVLLRTLETRLVRRVGSQQERAVDVRVVAASHRNLDAMVSAGTFRQDLLYRLNAFTIDVPALRERPGDIVPLAERFLADCARRDHCTLSLDDDARAALRAAAWPGNVRELRNVIERAVVLRSGPVLRVDDLPPTFGAVAKSVATPAPSAPLATSTLRTAPAWPPLDSIDRPAEPLPERLDRLEAELIRRALIEHDDDTARAAEALGMPRRTLQHRIKLLGVSPR